MCRDVAKNRTRISSCLERRVNGSPAKLLIPPLRRRPSTYEGPGGGIVKYRRPFYLLAPVLLRIILFDGVCFVSAGVPVPGARRSPVSPPAPKSSAKSLLAPQFSERVDVAAPIDGGVFLLLWRFGMMYDVATKRLLESPMMESPMFHISDVSQMFCRGVFGVCLCGGAMLHDVLHL